MTNIRVIQLALLLILQNCCLADKDERVHLKVNNILRLDKNEKGGYKPVGDFYVEIEGNARGLPLLKNSSPPKVDSEYATYCCRNWTHDGWKELTPEEAYSLKLAPLLSLTEQFGGQTVAPVWHTDNSKGQLTSPPGQLPQNQLCITVLARIPENGTLTVKIQSANGVKNSRIGTLRGRDREWQLRRFESRTPRDFRKLASTIVLTVEKPDFVKDDFYLQWAGFCVPATQPHKLEFGGKYDLKNATDEMRLLMIRRNNTVRINNGCENGGSMDVGAGCFCPPGFSGGVCETGCGPNKFGDECTLECSDTKGGRDCGGFKVNVDGHWACVSGWEGETCDQKCRSGFYGSECKQKCGVSKGGDPCNRHTGYCEDGCEDGYQPPFCQDVCGRVTTPGPLKDGSIADPKDFPWNAGVYDLERGPEPQIICMATLISRTVAISAAHCFYQEATSLAEDPGRFTLIFGRQRHALNATDLYKDEIQERKIRKIAIPPTFRGLVGRYFNDIAVLAIQSIDITDLVRPACFDWTGHYTPDLEDSNGEVVGWGKDDNGNKVEKLLLARPSFINLQDCFKFVDNSFVSYIGPDKFCGRNIGGQALRRGSSGSGYVFSGFLIGVTSASSATEHKIVAFTNISFHLPWLKEVRATYHLLDAVIEDLNGSKDD